MIHTFSGVGGEGGQGSSVAFSPDGARILSGDTIFGALELWDAKSGELIRTMHSTGGAVASVAFSPDGTRLVSGGFHNTPKLWDARSGQLIQTLNGHLRGVRSVMFSGNGARLISGGEDGTIRIWKASTGELLASLIAVKDGEWIAVTPEGFFQGSANGAKMLSVVRGLEVHSGERFQEVLHRPDLVREKLAGDPVGRVRQAAATLDLAKLMKNSARP
ncbi:MAG: WD40 repeat domain-containing protein [Rhodomicrobiaceae bacterium]